MIKPSTMKALLNDVGYTACKVQTEDEYRKCEGLNKKTYSFMLGILPQNLTSREKCVRRVIEIDGEVAVWAKEAVLNIGE